MTPQFTANCAQLLNALTIASRAAAKKTPMPILTHLLVEANAETDDVTVTGSNLEMWIRHSFKANVCESGSCTLPAKMFTDSVSKLSDLSVIFGPGKTEYSTLLTSGRAKITIAGLDPEESVRLPDIKDSLSFTVPVSDLKFAAQMVLPACSVDETRIQMTGVNMTVNDGLLRLTATDTLKMIMRDVANVSVPDINHTIPQEAMRAIVATAIGDNLSIDITDHQARFVTIEGGLKTEIITRLYAEAYPNTIRFRKMYEEKVTGSILMHREDMTGALARAGVFRASVIDGFTITLQDDTALFELAKKPEGSNSEEIEVIVTDQCASVCKWSIDFMGQGVNGTTSEGLRIAYVPMVDHVNAILTSPDDPKFWALVMGMRMD